MTSNYLDLTLMDFFDTITNKKQEYSLKISDKKGKECEYIGNKTELKELLLELNEELISQFSQTFTDMEEYTSPFELTSIEIYNYLEKITSNFNPVKVKLILDEMEMYNCMYFHERINDESWKIYTKNKWEIPLIEFDPIFPKGAPFVKIPDYKTMTHKTHFCEGWNIDGAIRLLKDKLNEDKSIDNEKIGINSGNKLIENEDIKKINPYSSIFINTKAFELFEYLLEKFGGKEISHADCSFIFRQMQSDDYIYESTNESDFRLFLSKYYELEMDKLKTLGNCNKGLKMSVYSTSVSFIYKK